MWDAQHTAVHVVDCTSKCFLFCIECENVDIKCDVEGVGIYANV